MLAGLQDHLTNAPAPDWGALLAQDIDWSRVLAMCHFHEVTPLVYESLKPHSLPREVSSRFRKQALRNAQHSFKLARALKTLITRFGAEGIEVAPYKGVVLSERLFGGLARRPAKDIDIIVQKTDYEQAKDVLLKSGYTGPLSANGKLTIRDPVVYNSAYHALFLHKVSGHYLELHTRLTHSGRQDGFKVEQLWEELSQETWQGETIQKMSEDFLFLSLSVHASKHWWKRLKWLFDLSYLLDTQAIPESLLARAKEDGILRGVLANAFLSHKLFLLELPAALTAALEQTDITDLSELALKRCASWPHAPMKGFAALKFYFLLTDRRTSHDGWKLIRGKLKMDYGL